MDSGESLRNVLNNVDAAREYGRDNDSVGIVAVVSGSEADRDAWQGRLEGASPYIFNSDGSTWVLSLQEKTGRKTREGNFLGTLLAYRNIKKAAVAAGVPYREIVTLVGMLLGRGERMSPVTQSKGCRKPGIEVTPAGVCIGPETRAFTAIEEALLYFTPVAKYLEKRGFRGIVDKWGDETEIASIDLAEEPDDRGSLAGYDIIKTVSVMEVSEAFARHKDWVIFDAAGRMLRQISRSSKDVIIGHLKELGIQPREDGKYYAGVSLGPVAVSYDVLDIAADIFADEIKTEGVHLDFDPYFLMALAMEDDLHRWEEAVAADKSLAEVTALVPELFQKAQEVKKIFREKHGRDLNLKILDLGGDVYWADIGQHSSMRKKYLALNDKGPLGVIARKLACIPEGRDGRGNIVIGSDIGPDVVVKDSVIVGSRVTGPGKIEGSVILDSELGGVDITGAFAVRSVRPGRIVLPPRSGIYDSLGADDLVLEAGHRHVSVLTAGGRVDMKCAEETNLRDKDNTIMSPFLIMTSLSMMRIMRWLE